MATAVSGNINPYAAEAVVFNSQPYVNFALQARAREQAKGEALDKFLDDQGKSLTPAGMHGNDVDDWMQKVNDWKSFTIQNRAALRNPAIDGGKALTQANYLYNDALGYAEKSKYKVKGLGDLKATLSDPDKRSRLSPAALQQIEKASLPLSNPNYSYLDPTQVDYAAKPFDAPAQQKYLSSVIEGLSMGDIVEDVKTDPKTLSKVTTLKSTYSKDALQEIYNRASARYQLDPSIHTDLTKIFSKEDAYEKLNPIFKAAYGKDIQNNEDAAAAWTLNQIELSKKSQKVADDIAARQQRQLEGQKELERIKQGNRINLIKFRESFKGSGSDEKKEWVENLINEMNNDALATGRMTYKSTDGTETKEYATKASPEILETFALRDSKGHKVLPDKLVFTSEGNLKPIFYLRNEDGKVKFSENGYAGVDREKSQPVLRSEAIAQIGKKLLGVNILSKEMNQVLKNRNTTAPKKQSKQPAKTSDDPLGLGF